MSQIIDSIQVSGITYTLSGSGGNPTVELTQEQYDALVSAGTVSPTTYYIITDATPIDVSNYWTSAQTQSAITQAVSGKADTSAVTESINSAVSGKQDTLVSGTNIKTINNESLLGSGNITIQGGGSSYTAGDGIDITNDVISVTGMVNTSAITSSVTSASTDSEIPTAKAVYDAIPTGGTSITIDPSFDVSSTNPVANSAVTRNLTNGNGNVYNTGGRYKWEFYSVGGYGTNQGFWLDTINGETVVKKQNNTRSLQLVETSAITTSVTSSSTDAQVPSAKAVNDKLGGLSIVKLTESEYAALVTKDSDTLYVVIPDPSN